MLNLLIKLVIAHILGDFVFQPKSWVENKNSFQSKYLYLHGLVHAIALLILLQFNWSYWWSILIIVISHLLLDLLKAKLSKKFNTRMLFVIDQILHLSILVLVVYLQKPFQINIDSFYTTKSLMFILAILGVTYVSAITMQIILSKWVLEEDKSGDSLKNAGKYIGVLERLFVFGFILLNQWSAIGLLITAKSVFRFGDLSRAKDRKLTEYILIGTLLSFGMAILIGVCYQYSISIL